MEESYPNAITIWSYYDRLQYIMDALGYDNCVVMSDAGQSHNPLPPEAVWLYAQGLYEKGVSPGDLEKLVDKTPKALLGI